MMPFSNLAALHPLFEFSQIEDVAQLPTLILGRIVVGFSVVGVCWACGLWLALSLHDSQR